MPFKVLGAPFIDSEKLLDAILPFLHQNDVIDTVSFIPRSLPGKSSYPKYQDELCHGLRIQNMENPINTTVHLFQVLQTLYPDKFQFLESNFIDKLYGSNALRMTVQSGDDVSPMILGWELNLAQFHEMSNKYHLYP